MSWDGCKIPSQCKILIIEGNGWHFLFNFSVNPKCSKKILIRGKGIREKRSEGKKAALYTGPGSRWALSKHLRLCSLRDSDSRRAQEVVDELEMHTLDNLWLQRVLPTKGYGSSVTSACDSARKLETWILSYSCPMETSFVKHCEGHVYRPSAPLGLSLCNSA